MRLPVNHALPFVLPLILTAALAGCGTGEALQAAPPPPPVNGPAADYPMVLGAPFQVGSTTYTPEDKLNYDAVGYAVVGSEGEARISGAHKTLPLPSYVEVTSLESGKTILLRVERRGPMSNDQLIELSPGAAAQLGVAGEARPAVRVRRVNPPEQERALLRSGQRAPERMATPKGLLDALNRKLNVGAPLMSSAPTSVPTAAASAAPPPPGNSPVHPVPPPRPTPVPIAKPTSASKPAATPAERPAPTPRPAPVSAAAHGGAIVQVATFSTQDRAKGVAGKLGGRVNPAGRFWRVQLGPFASRSEAEAALAKAKAAGYSDARIQRAD
jgi:rare lipoprotein A